MAARNRIPAHVDVAIIGGGIAGGALATVLARSGLDVIVLERDAKFRDRNKGENMMPWGWADAARMGLLGTFDDAGAIANPMWEVHDPFGSMTSVPVALMHAEAPGTYSVAHPVARRALCAAAADAGAHVVFGASDVDVAMAANPTVRWMTASREHVVRTRLVVGADGRGSGIRRALGFQLGRTARTHVISSQLAASSRGGNRSPTVHVAVGRERLSLCVPLGAGRARLYLVSRDDQFAGVDGALAMFEAVRSTHVSGRLPWDDLTPVGPAATYGGEDAWVAEPAIEGAVLIGDAAGYNSPIIGQGLAIAMRDARLVSEALLAHNRWHRSVFRPYVTERRERLRRLRIVAQRWAEVHLSGDDAFRRAFEGPAMPQVLAGIFGGFDGYPPELFSDESLAALANGASMPTYA